AAPIDSAAPWTRKTKLHARAQVRDVVLATVDELTATQAELRAQQRAAEVDLHGPPPQSGSISPAGPTGLTIPAMLISRSTEPELVAGLRDRPGSGPFVADVGGDRHRDSTSSFDQRNRLSELLGCRSARLTLSYCRSLAVAATDQGSYVRRIACSWLSARR